MMQYKLSTVLYKDYRGQGDQCEPLQYTSMPLVDLSVSFFFSFTGTVVNLLKQCHKKMNESDAGP